jgi:adenylyltransferase/sulfurtransferase
VANPETLAVVACSGEPGNEVPTVTTAELRILLNGGFSGLLIDVREAHEHAAANIPQARLIPLGLLEAAIPELPRDRDLYLHCKSGMRSARAAKLLREHGFTRVWNVEGGIDAWLRDHAHAR